MLALKDIPHDFSTIQPKLKHSIVSYPAKHVVLVTVNRPKQLNSFPHEATLELDAFWNWYDNEPELRCAIITGAGDKAFSAGMDLKDLLQEQEAKARGEPTRGYNGSGVGGLSNRAGKKPVLAAVNGLAHGGGFEIVLNCDVVFSVPNATFALPEVHRGVVAFAGALPCSLHAIGMQRTMDLVLTGASVTAQQLVDWGIIKELLPTRERLLERVIEYATVISGVSPDSVIVTRAGVREGWETGNVYRASSRTLETYESKLLQTENAQEGLRAFKERRKPKWVGSKL